MGRWLSAVAVVLGYALTAAMLPQKWDAAKQRFVANAFSLTGADAPLPATTITASGQTAWFDASDLNRLNLVLAIAGPVTGTTPSLTMIVETDDGAGGNVQTLFTFAAQTAVQAGLRKGGIVGLDQRWRLRWTVTGTTPSFGGVTVTGDAR